MADALIGLVRHGKAESESDSGRDEDRRLKEKGERQADYLGEWFARGCGGAVGEGVKVAAVVSSPAVRARQTAERIAGACGVAVEFDERLFIGAAVSNVFAVAGEWARQVGGGVVVLVGHNPTFGRTVGQSVGGVGAWEAEVRTGEAHVFRYVEGEGGLVVEPGGGELVARERWRG